MKSIVHTFAILFVIGSGSFEAKGKELKVLFIGNSHTYTMQNTLDNVIQASPYSESIFEYVATGGWTLQQHLESNNTMSRIKSQDWDFVVLQEHGVRSSRPDEREQFYDAVAKLSEAIRESGAKVVLYMVWGYYGNETMRQSIIEGYRRAAHQVDAIVSPVGLAWQRVRRNKPYFEEQLYVSDGNHSSYKGSFLISCVLYATLFDADPTQLEFNGSLLPAEAAYLKLKAKEAFNPVVDFNEDGVVDCGDMCIMVDC